MIIFCILYLIDLFLNLSFSNATFLYPLKTLRCGDLNELTSAHYSSQLRSHFYFNFFLICVWLCNLQSDNLSQ